MQGLFQGKDKGVTSMRRVLAFLFALASIAGGMASVFLADNTWHMIAAAYMAPGAISLLFMGLTTVEDITNIIKAAKGNSIEKRSEEQ